MPAGPRSHRWRRRRRRQRAAQGPFGRTIAHGLRTLSLLPVLLTGLYRIENVRMGANHGFNKARFPAPVAVRSRVRATAAIAEATRSTDVTILRSE
ncbi:MaoC/PaaZ C-terminal domain-containing protein [Actinomycetospora sp. CA-101289]|uniref:MaoC/PaaZ C-terminal domain-containing protein n=1 Tax=Actinomycetospora sp. CA-101289 TaxID=3239893 RepID=UPI003D9676F7